MRLLRLEFEPWRPADILALGKLLAFGLATNWERELLRADMVRALGPELTARLDPGYPVGNPIATHEAWSGDGLAIAEQIDSVRRAMGMATEASGSNNWAVSGELQRHRLAADRRRPASRSEHARHLVPGRPAPSAGVSSAEPRFPGLPGVYMGQNNDVCWTFTNVMPDVQDLFVERVEGERYLFEDEWLPLEARREEIVVKGRNDPELLEVRTTHHGPIVNEALGADDAEPLALRWLSLDEPTAFPGMLELHDIGSGPELVDGSPATRRLPRT